MTLTFVLPYLICFIIAIIIIIIIFLLLMFKVFYYYNYLCIVLIPYLFKLNFVLRIHLLNYLYTLHNYYSIYAA